MDVLNLITRAAKLCNIELNTVAARDEQTDKRVDTYWERLLNEAQKAGNKVTISTGYNGSAHIAVPDLIDKSNNFSSFTAYLADLGVKVTLSMFCMDTGINIYYCFA